MLNKLRDQNIAATTRTFENIKNVKKGSAGLAGPLLTAAGAVAAGSMGLPPSVGANFGSALIPDEYGGPGGDAMSQAIVQGAGAYGSMNQGGPRPPTGSRPQTNYAWYEDDPNQGWWDTWGQTPAQTQLNVNEQALAQQNWDTRLARRRRWVNQQLSPTPASSPRAFDYNAYFRV